MPADNHTHDHGSELSEMQLRVRALETILTEKGYVDPATLDQIVETVETKIGPHIGARIVARAWVDPDFKRRLLADATEAVNSAAGFEPVSNHLVAVENTPQIHNVVVCTLCSCYPWSVAGSAAGLVQIGTLSLTHGDRPSGGPSRFRRQLAGRH